MILGEYRGNYRVVAQCIVCVFLTDINIQLILWLPGLKGIKDDDLVVGPVGIVSIISMIERRQSE